MAHEGGAAALLVFVAQILPMTNDANFEADVMKYNAPIPNIVTSKASRVCMVNMHDSFSAGDFVDGVHPNRSGYEKMASIWESAIRAMLGGGSLSEGGYRCGQSPSASSLPRHPNPQSKKTQCPMSGPRSE
jgi:hypothetical protein